MKLWPYLFAAAVLVVALFGMSYFLGSHPGGERASVLNKTAWQRMALPGKLSQAHAFLEHNCGACHTAVQGADSAKCIACHANNEALLQRQPTAFHAAIESCRECHLEHQGVARRPSDMDHAVLARIGLRLLPGEKDADAAGRSVARSVRERLAAWIDHSSANASLPYGHPGISPQEAVLNCATCHSNQDHHFKLFGSDCAQCHSTTKWTIPEFRHPSPRSQDCAQCHQAPPSHYMEHFHMVSMKVAGKPHAQVSQCYLCHQTTAWNDIQGVGWYKHH